MHPEKFPILKLTGRVENGIIYENYTRHGWPEGATGENVCSSRCFNGFHHQHIHLLQNDKFENIW